jgi:flagellar protein FlgJ
MLSDTAVYTDFQGFATMRKEAREHNPEAIKKVAKQFESLFMQMMLKSMRDTLSEDGMFNSKQQRMYQDMMDKQLSLNISMGQGMGLAAVIERQLAPQAEQSLPPPALADYFNRPVTPAAAVVAQTASLDNPYTETKVSSIADVDWQRPEQYVRDIWPHAVTAATELGVDAEVLVAQSALETGWGKHTRRFDNGENSFSLFGIKANADWQGKRIFVSTLEFKHGTMQREQAYFRAYDSIGEAFSDYARFIQDSPRYQQALAKGYSAKAYAEELQRAGYATDPDYAAKIERIRGGESFKTQVSALKNGAKVPLT